MELNRRLTLLTRVGFATRGILYLIIAALLVHAGQARDPAGALQYLGDRSGTILLAIMAAGLFAYGAWRICDAALNIERHASDGKGYVERAAAAFSGGIHLLLAWQAIRLIQGVRTAGDSAEEGARMALGIPGGNAIVMLAGIVLMATGFYQLLKAVRTSFLRHLDPSVANTLWAKWSGRLGYAARGIVFVVSGFFVVQAGFHAKANEAGGTAQALAWLDRPVDLLVAAGLFGFGLFSLIEARFRVLKDVPVDRLVQRAGPR